MRTAGAKAREMLKMAAADVWGVPASGLVAVDSTIKNPATGATLTFGSLAAAAWSQSLHGGGRRLRRIS